MAQQSVNVPDIGNYSNVVVVEVLVANGDTVALDDSMITLETEKATMEIPAPFAGKVVEMKLKVGDRVSQGDLILMMDVAEGAAASPPIPAAVIAPAVAPCKVAEPPTQNLQNLQNLQKQQPIPTGIKHPVIYASPAVRRMAREQGVEIALLQGSGANGRITVQDLQSQGRSAGGGGFNFPGRNIADIPKSDPSQYGAVTTVPLSNIQKISGSFLHRNWLACPHVTQFDTADITELEEFRKLHKDRLAQDRIKLTPIVFLMKALVACLRKFPKFNAELSQNGIDLILKQYFHIGFAVDTPNGLVVPVIRNVDQKSLGELAVELSEISSTARAGKLKPSDMQGGCFTISSLGGIGGTNFTPIINLPEVAILGVAKATIQPVYQKDQFVPRLIMPLALSYDHRVIDGADGVRFTSYLSQLLTDIRQLLL